MPTREEYVAQVEEEMEELYTRLGREANEAAIAAREDEPDTAETEEEYYFRIAHVPGIFGDTPTEFDAVVPTKNEEAAGVAVAEADSSDEVVADDSSDEAVSLDVPEAPETQDAREGAAVDPAHPELAGDVQNGETEVPATEVVASDEEDAEHAE